MKINYTDYSHNLSSIDILNVQSCGNYSVIQICSGCWVITNKDYFISLSHFQTEFISYYLNLLNEYKKINKAIYVIIQFSTKDLPIILLNYMYEDCNELLKFVYSSNYSLFQYLSNQYFICKRNALFSKICFNIDNDSFISNNTFIISNNMIVSNNKDILEIYNASNDRRIGKIDNYSSNQIRCKKCVVFPIDICYYNHSKNSNSKRIKSDRYCEIEDYEIVVNECESSKIYRNIYFVKKSSSVCIENSSNKPQNNSIICEHLPFANYMTVITLTVTIILIITIIIAHIIVIWSFHHNFISQHKIHYILATLCSFLISEIIQLLLNIMEMNDNRCYILQSFHTLFRSVGIMLIRVAYDHIIEEEINAKVISKKGHFIYLSRCVFMVLVQIFIVFFITDRHLLIKKYNISSVEIEIPYCGRTNEKELTTNLIPV